MLRLSVLVLDSEMRMLYASRIVPPLTEADVVGELPWSRKFIDKAGGERLRRTWARCEARGEIGTVDSVSKQIGTWRTLMHPVGKGGVRAIWLVYKIPESLPRLTERELEIARLIVAGRNSKEIAGALGMSLSTVSSHRAKMSRKLGCHASSLDVFVGMFAGVLRGAA